jgi:hypothetical protein
MIPLFRIALSKGKGELKDLRNFATKELVAAAALNICSHGI